VGDVAQIELEFHGVERSCRGFSANELLKRADRRASTLFRSNCEREKPKKPVDYYIVIMSCELLLSRRGRLMTDGNETRYQREVNKQREEVEPLPVDFTDDREKLQVYNINNIVIPTKYCIERSVYG